MLAKNQRLPADQIVFVILKSQNIEENKPSTQFSQPKSAKAQNRNHT